MTLTSAPPATPAKSANANSPTRKRLTKRRNPDLNTAQWLPVLLILALTTAVHIHLLTIKATLCLLSRALCLALYSIKSRVLLLYTPHILEDPLPIIIGFLRMALYMAMFLVVK